MRYEDISRLVPFDQYQRYHLIQRVVDICASKRGTRILEVGGAHSPLHEMVPDHRVISADVIPAPGLHLRASGMHLPFRDRAFEIVVSTDVLEHIQTEERKSFVQDLARTTSGLLILGFPHRTAEVQQADKTLFEFVLRLTGKEYPFLKEHADYGLPDPAEIRALLKVHLPEMLELKNAGVDSWLPLMMANFALEDHPELNEPRLLLNEFFNRYFDSGSHTLPAYRTVLISSRKPLAASWKKQILQYGGNEWNAPLQGYATTSLALALSFRSALRQHTEMMNARIIQLQRGIELEQQKSTEIRRVVQDLEQALEKHNDLLRRKENIIGELGSREQKQTEREEALKSECLGLKHEISKQAAGLVNQMTRLNRLEAELYRKDQELETLREELSKTVKDKSAGQQVMSEE